MGFKLTDAPKYTEDLHCLQGYKVGIDAATLLAMCTRSQPDGAIQAANSSLDPALLANLSEILKTLNNTYKVQVCIVVTGLKPACLSTETSSIENSYNLWHNKQDGFQQILKLYGAAFYTQELANAATQTGNDIFIAPYTASAQLAMFFRDMVFNVCIGSLALLAYDGIDQAVTSIDLQAGTFTFVDRADLGLS